MSTAQYDELEHAEKEVARLVEEIRFAESLGIPAAAEALPGLRRRLAAEMVRRDRAKREAGVE
jgi:hypothetical protein